MKFRRKRSWLFRITWPITHYLVINLSAAVGYVFFKVFHHTTILGRENIPMASNTLLLSNHQSMIDSFLVGLFAFFPRTLLRPSLLPWHPAAEENFYRTPILAWLADNWKCIPIKRGRKDVGAIFRMARALKSSPLILFPEGTRSRDGSIGRPRGGAGLLIMETKPAVVPVAIVGMNKVLPIGSIFPRLFKRVYLYFGEPLDLSEFYNQEKNKDTAKAIMNRVMERIRAMRSEIEALEAKKNLVTGKELLDNKKTKGLVSSSK